MVRSTGSSSFLVVAVGALEGAMLVMLASIRFSVSSSSSVASADPPPPPPRVPPAEVHRNTGSGLESPAWHTSLTVSPSVTSWMSSPLLGSLPPKESWCFLSMYSMVLSYTPVTSGRSTLMLRLVGGKKTLRPTLALTGDPALAAFVASHLKTRSRK